jgi:protein-arginine kinase activator protein McsA
MTALAFLRERLARAIKREDWETAERLRCMINELINGPPVPKKAAS